MLSFNILTNLFYPDEHIGKLNPTRANKRFSPPFCELKVFAMSVNKYKQSFYKKSVNLNVPPVRHTVLLPMMDSASCSPPFISSNETQVSGVWENDENIDRTNINRRQSGTSNDSNKPVKEIAEIGTIRTIHVKEDRMNRIHYMYNSKKKSRRRRFN